MCNLMGHESRQHWASIDRRVLHHRIIHSEEVTSAVQADRNGIKLNRLWCKFTAGTLSESYIKLWTTHDRDAPKTHVTVARDFEVSHLAPGHPNSGSESFKFLLKPKWKILTQKLEISLPRGPDWSQKIIRV